MMWFLKMIKTSEHDILFAAICQTPTEMFGKNLNEVNIDEFHCGMLIYDFLGEIININFVC